MKHAGKARRAARRLIGMTLMGVLIVVLPAGLVQGLEIRAEYLAAALLALWAVFALFTLYFFRDPEAHPPAGAGLVVSPAHGRVDVVDTTTEARFLGGECRRISIFLSLFNVHVQQAPVSGRVRLVEHTPGRYLSAFRRESSLHNENVLLGLEASDPAGERIGVRLIAGVLARRILPWVTVGEEVARGGRISLIQFGSRVELYLPLRAKLRVQVGDEVVGGETVVAVFE